MTFKLVVYVYIPVHESHTGIYASHELLSGPLPGRVACFSYGLRLVGYGCSSGPLLLLGRMEDAIMLPWDGILPRSLFGCIIFDLQDKVVFLFDR